MECDLASSVPDWIIEYPETTRFFDELQIDVSCAGKSLEYVCRTRGFDPSAVLEHLHRIIADSRTNRSE